MSTQLNAANTDFHRFIESATNNGTPPSGFGDFWFKDDGTPQATNDAGTDFDLSGSGSVTLTGVETLTNKTMDFASNTFQNTGLGELGRIAGSTYSTIQHLQDIFHSSGVSSGGGVTDDADGTITVAAGTGFIRATDSDVAEILFMDWAAESGANVALTDNDMNFLYVEYNSGSPQVIATISKRTDTNTNISLGTVYRLGTTLHITMNTRPIVGNHALQMILRLDALNPFAHESGGIVSETGTRNLAVTAGAWWGNLTDFTTAAIDTSVADTWEYFYDDGASGWTTVSSATQFNNTQYDDGSGTLATLSNNSYGVHWIYLDVEGDVYVVYGTVNGTLTVANDAGIPSSVPPWFGEDHARLIGKAIIKKSDAALTSIQTVFNGAFSLESATDHGGLTGLADDDHTQYSLIETGAGAPSSTPTREGQIYVDTTGKTPYISTDTASSADWDDVSAGGGGATPTFHIGGFTTGTVDTTSSTYATIDATNIKQSVTLTGGETVIARFTLSAVIQITGGTGTFKLVADTTNPDTLVEYNNTGTGASKALALVGKWTGLGAGTFDFRPQFKTSANTCRVNNNSQIGWDITVYA